MAEFLYRPILEEVTHVAKDRQLDPYEAYVWLYEKAAAQHLRGETYASTSITSGGHARDDSLEMGAVIARNTESARLLAEQLAADNQIDPKTTIEPVFVGKTGWSQSEYMEFWLAVIAGADLEKGFYARDLDGLRASQRTAFERANVDVEAMNSHAPAGDRAVEYFKMAAASAEAYKADSSKMSPVDRVVRMIDADQSLGAQAERAFARELAVSVMNICIVKPASPEDLAPVNRELALDTQRLIKFGAAVFDTATSQARLQLIEAA